MDKWLAFWLAVTLVEGAATLLINRFICDFKSARIVIWAIVGGSSTLATAMLLQTDWKLYLILGILHFYRLVNIARILRWRLQRRRLQNASFKTWLWVFGLQVVFTILVGLFDKYINKDILLWVITVAEILVLAFLVRISSQTWVRTRPKQIDHYLSDSELPPLSVLVAARNETDSLRECLESLVHSEYPKLEIIVLDDCSVNRRTPEIIRDFAHDGVRFIAGKVPAERWLPKNFAYEKLRQEASGEVFLFCGVDTRFTPSSLRTLVSSFTDKKLLMMSVMPQRIVDNKSRLSLLQPMRYFWELCLPRRIFKRPPVLSTCWLARAEFLEKCGGFESVASSITPEAHFSRQATVSNSYAFLRSNRNLPIFSAKNQDEQYQTTLRVRYPQLHRRLELVAATAMFEVFCFILPFGVLGYALLEWNIALILASLASSILVTVLFSIVSIKTKLCTPFYGVASTLIAFLLDVIVLHVSCLQYEFGSVTWKGRNVCLPVMQVIPRLPKLED